MPRPKLSDGERMRRKIIAAKCGHAKSIAFFRDRWDKARPAVYARMGLPMPQIFEAEFTIIDDPPDAP